MPELGSKTAGEVQPALTKAFQTRQELLDSIRGQRMYVPDLWVYFQHWPTGVNVELERLRRDETEWLDRQIPSLKRREALKKADFSLLGAGISPWATYENLRIASLLNIWIFVVDDELDIEDASMANDLETANLYRHDLKKFVQSCLGLSNPQGKAMWRYSTKDNDYDHIIQSFTDLGETIREKFNSKQRQKLFDSIKYYLDMTKEEQCSRLNGGVPSPDEYWAFREGASAMDVCLTMVELLVTSTGLPHEVFDDPEMKRLWTLTNINVACVNDIFSAKKEIMGSSIANAIPTLYAAAEGQDRLQTATNQVVDVIASTITETDEVANRLLSRYGNGDPCDQTTKDLQSFIDRCKLWCTGNLNWSYQTKRYGKLGENRGIDGSLVIQL